MADNDSANKRRRTNDGAPNWRDLPAFMDATVSVSAATFGARRLPEIRQLYHRAVTSTTPKTNVTTAFQSGGGKTSSRHLRRRTTAVKTRRHRHRFPLGKGENPSGTKPDAPRKTQRKRQATLCQGHYQWQIPSTNTVSDNQDQISRNKTSNVHWMSTHIWHAKRFHMANLWGWQVPLAHTNRGARAALRLSKEGYCTLQDLTWERGYALNVTAHGAIHNVFSIFSRMFPTSMPKSGATEIDDEYIGEGIVHAIDQFPMGAIGPGWWHITRPTSAESWNVRVMVHPSIRATAEICLQTLISENPNLLQWALRPTQCSCIRLCGEMSTQILNETLGLSTVRKKLGDDSIQWENATKEHMDIPHGSIVRVRLDQSLLKLEASEECLLVRQAPRPLDCPSNHVISGWDLYCPPNTAKNVWMALALHGKCVAIGIVEQSHLQLECEPPLPVFPRDDIDSAEGKEYWSGTNPSWQLVRKCYEGGWGRLPVAKDVSLTSLVWSELLFEKRGTEPTGNTETSNANVQSTVMVRDSFGQPFQMAIQGCASFPTLADELPKRRKRRQVTPYNKVKYAEPLTTPQANEWYQMINTLLGTLSLPAVLRVHIRLVGSGTVDVGAKVLVNEAFVGYATSGNFSPVRGVCHGNAVLGASRLLRALSGSTRNLGRVVRLCNGEQEIQVAGTLNSVDGFQATLSIVL